MSEAALSIDRLAVVLHRNGAPVSVLADVRLALAPGEVLALVGESGSGKSTLGLALQGLLPAEAAPRIAGSVRVGGMEVVGARPPELRMLRRKVVRVVPQDPMAGLNPTMKIGRQLAESGGSGPTIRDWLARTGLHDAERILNALPHELSGGQRQRVLIAMAMLARPQLLIADEPTTALDTTTQAHILALLRRLAEQCRTAILFITHDLAVAGSLADRIAVLHGGRIVETASARALLAAPQHIYTQRLLTALRDVNTCPAAPGERGAGTALRLSSVTKSYRLGRQPVLKSVNLLIRKGECVALVGESGAGKSTVLRIAAGLVAPDSGDVARADLRPQMVFQDPASAFTPWLRIGEQIGDRLGRQRDRHARVGQALEWVGLDPAMANALPGELSLGQCQRAALARAVVAPPALLLCDEPVSAMDMPLAVAILDLLSELRHRLGMAVLFVTHDLAVARKVGDNIAVLKDGELVEEAAADDLLDNPQTDYTRALIAAAPARVSIR